MRVTIGNETVDKGSYGKGESMETVKKSVLPQLSREEEMNQWDTEEFSGSETQ